MLSLNTTRNPRSGADIPANTQCEPALTALCIAHDDLDAVIATLLAVGFGDDLLLTRLKKRKLRIKDEIAALRTQNEPASVSRAS